MTKNQRSRFFVNRTRREREKKQEEQEKEKETLQRQVTSSLLLLTEYHEEVVALSEALERLSSLPRELNNWYGKYTSARKKYEDSLKLLQGYKDQNQALARRLEEVQMSWRSLDTQLRQRSKQFHFAYSSHSSHYTPY